MALQSRLKGTFSHFVFINRLAPSTQIDEKTHTAKHALSTSLPLNTRRKVVTLPLHPHYRRGEVTKTKQTDDEAVASICILRTLHLFLGTAQPCGHFAFVKHIQHHGGTRSIHVIDKKKRALYHTWLVSTRIPFQTAFDQFLVHRCGSGRRNTGISLRPGVL
ncbi:unnamed protein product [Ectocarpus sp. 8 AP-2014]